MNTAHHLITVAALAGALLLEPTAARAHHCGGTDTSDFSYMGTTCRYQRWTGPWQYNHDMTVTDDYDPYIIVQRVTEVNNCGSSSSTQVTTDATTTDSDTASYSVGVSLSTAEKAAIASDLAANLQISVEPGFSAGTQTSSTVSGTVGSIITSQVAGCTRTTIQVSVIGFHNATVTGSVSQRHWFRIHCDDPTYTTSWNVCDTSTQSVTGSSSTGCLSRAYVQSSSTDSTCAPEELSPECVSYPEPDAGVADAGVPASDGGWILDADAPASDGGWILDASVVP